MFVPHQSPNVSIIGVGIPDFDCEVGGARGKQDVTFYATKVKACYCSRVSFESLLMFAQLPVPDLDAAVFRAGGQRVECWVEGHRCYGSSV